MATTTFSVVVGVDPAAQATTNFAVAVAAAPPPVGTATTTFGVNVYAGPGFFAQKRGGELWKLQMGSKWSGTLHPISPSVP